MAWVSEPLPLDGAALKDQGMARALSGAVPWPDVAMAWVRALPRGEWFTSEDITEAIGLPRGEVGKDANNAVGAVVNAAARAGLIHRESYVPASRSNSHGAVIGLWRRT